MTLPSPGLIILTGRDRLFSFVSKDKAENIAHIVKFGGGLFLVFFGYLMTHAT